MRRHSCFGGGLSLQWMAWKKLSGSKKLLELYDMSYPDQRPAPPLYHGCGDFLPDERTAVDSEAVEDLIARASQYSAENPLYVIGIAALTDIASAILKAPEIVEKIVVI